MPPISLRQQDLKQEYSVQTAKTSYLYFNYGTHSSAPDQVLDKVMDGARIAFQKVVDSLNEEYKKYCHASGFPTKSCPGGPGHLLSRVVQRVKVEKGREVDENAGPAAGAPGRRQHR